MKIHIGRNSASLFLALAFLGGAAFAQQAPQKPAEWKPVESAMGRSGDVQADGALKFAMPRKDLKVSVGGTQVKAGFALGSWAAFDKPGNQSMLMGDLVLTEDEVGAVMQKLLSGGVQVTALHNHVLHETPRVMYMHIGGMGEAAKLAQAVHDAVALTKTPAPDTTAPPEEKLDIDQAQIEQALGQKGKVKGGVLQFGVPRAAKITMHGTAIPNSMGICQAINFQPTSAGKAAITGDFVLIGNEVGPVMRALRDHGIQVTALHSHMIEEEPRLFFMHFWANDNALNLAKGLRTALDKIDLKR